MRVSWKLLQFLSWEISYAFLIVGGISSKRLLSRRILVDIPVGNLLIDSSDRVDEFIT